MNNQNIYINDIIKLLEDEFQVYVVRKLGINLQLTPLIISQFHYSSV